TAPQVRGGYWIEIDDRFDARHCLSASSKCRDKSLERLVQVLPEAFIIEEEKCLVLFDRPAHAGAELIPPKWRCALKLKEIARVQLVVAQKFIDRSVKRVCPGFRYRVDRRSVAAELRTVSVGERLEFRDRFDSQRCTRDRGAAPSLPPVLDVFAIKKHPVPFWSRAGNGIWRCTADERGHVSGWIRLGAGRQQDQLFEISPVQRQFAHLSLIHERRNGGRRGLDLRDVPGHADRFLCLSDGHMQVDNRMATDRQFDIAAHYSLEPSERSLHFIHSNRQLWGEVTALIVRNDVARKGRSYVFDSDRCARNRRTCRIEDRAGNCCGGALRVQVCNCEDQDEGH